MRRAHVHSKRYGVFVPDPPADPSPNVVTLGATALNSNLRPALALVGNNTLFNTTAKATMAACCMDVIVHAISFAQRTDLWPTQATPTSSWNWGGLDARVNAINAAGCRAYVMLGMPPPWMFPAGTDINTQFFPNANLADAVTFATALATRYVPGGAFGNGVYGFCSHNECKGLQNANPWRYVDFTTIYNAMYSAIKGVSASIKVGGPYISEPRITAGHTGYVSNPNAANYIYAGVDSGGQVVTVDSRAADYWIYWYANKTGADFVCHDGNYRQADATTNWIKGKGVNPVTTPIMWAEFYAAAYGDTYYSATPTTREKTLRLIHNMIIAAYAGAGPICVWGGDTGSAGPYPENGIWDHTTGLATDTGTLMKLLKDNFAQGVDLKTFNSNNPGIIGIGSATKLLIINKTAASQVTDTPGGTITLDPKAWVLQ